jgi:indole-3-glycerol phosphate synthase
VIPLYDSRKKNGKKREMEKHNTRKENRDKEEAFDTLRTKLRLRKTISQPKHDYSLIIEPDALSPAIGLIVYNMDNLEITEPLAFFSRIPKALKTHRQTHKKC